MRSETSFFSLTLFRKLLTRYWPIWASWLAIWLLAMPVSLWNKLRVFAGYPDFGSFERVTVSEVKSCFPVTAATASAIAIVTAIAVFFYLFNHRATALMGALPIRREGLFLTSFAAGAVIIMAPLVVVALVSLGVEAAYGAATPGPLFQWLASSCLAAFFWFSFATLCCVISGNLIAAAAFFAIFNGVVFVMSRLVQVLLIGFYYGFAGLGDTAEYAVTWCTPILALSKLTALPGSWFSMVWIYVGVGILMALSAIGLHHIRKGERTGDLVAFKALRYAFKVCVILCGGVSLGILLTAIFLGNFESAKVGLIVACALSGALCAFIAEMLLKKSFRVGKSWPWAAAAVLFFVVVLGGMALDITGFTHRVPDPAQVRAVYVDCNGGAYVPAPAWEGLRFDEETAGAVTAAHRALADLGEDLDPAPADSDAYWRAITIRYTLKNGLTMSRRYNRVIHQGSELDTVLNDMFRAGVPDVQYPAGLPDRAHIYRNVAEEQESYLDRPLAAEDAQALWAAFLEDQAAGRYRALPEEVGEDGYPPIILNFQWWDIPDGEVTNCSVYPTSGTTSLNRAMEALAAE